MTEDDKRDEIPGSDLDDESTQLKKRARRRLIGASALALIAAIVLPMVMDHQPAPPMREIQVRIPSPDEGAPLRVAAKPVDAVKPKEETSKSVVQPKVETELAKAEQKPEQKSEPKIELKVEPKPEPKPEAKVEPKADATPVSKPEPKAEVKAEQKSEAKAEGKTEARSKPADEGKSSEAWEVQLGAYGEPARVKILLGKLKELNIPTYTEKVETPNGPRVRVRAGPFPTQAAADKARNRVKIVGVDGPVVKQP